MPPQHGKSELCSKYLPAWFLGTHPHHRVILTSYEADFAGTWGRKSRDLLDRFGVRRPGIEGFQRDVSLGHRGAGRRHDDGRRGWPDHPGAGRIC